MDSKWIALGLMAGLAALMVAAAISDLRTRTISNRLNAAIALLAPLFWVASGLAPWPDILWQIGAALALFLVFTGLFAVGAMGGGDVKMIGAVMLWIPLSLMLPSLMVMAVAGGLLSVALLIQNRWRPTALSRQVPYGVAIAAAGLWSLHQHYLNHFGSIAAT